MKMQRKHLLAFLAALCGTLGMAWGAHAQAPFARFAYSPDPFKNNVRA